ncbi:MAG: ABC transporter ATP-binding protein [Planctomycetota bacterium]|jgi:putative ABC transport system ATP-binding protein|nr:ABC transporter ATP-binding protein [Planctomycetota bacterium]MDA1200156.1 ABC transporter ATP-binding protein [Planctomycetota bacterium]
MAEPVIRLENVRKSFVMPGGERVEVLDVPGFLLQAGEQVALSGASGSGKSTLLHVISGIMRPDAGLVEVAGVDITRLPEGRRDRLRADSLGLVFQQFNLLPGFTALENVLVAMSFASGRPDRDRAAGLLEAVGLAQRLHHKPAELSIGQQQRVAVARALANQPRAVLADEPTASIDTAHKQQVVDLLKDTCGRAGVGLLVVTHDPDVARQFGRQLSLETFNRAGRQAV